MSPRKSQVVSHFGLAREGSRALQPLERTAENSILAQFPLEGRRSLGGPANETETPPSRDGAQPSKMARRWH